MTEVRRCLITPCVVCGERVHTETSGSQKLVVAYCAFCCSLFRRRFGRALTDTEVRALTSRFGYRPGPVGRDVQ